MLHFSLSQGSNTKRRKVVKKKEMVPYCASAMCQLSRSKTTLVPSDTLVFPEGSFTEGSCDFKKSGKNKTITFCFVGDRTLGVKS